MCGGAPADDKRAGWKSNLLSFSLPLSQRSPFLQNWPKMKKAEKCDIFDTIGTILTMENGHILVSEMSLHIHWMYKWPEAKSIEIMHRLSIEVLFLQFGVNIQSFKPWPS